MVNGFGRAVTSAIEQMNAKYFIVNESSEDIITVSTIDSETYTSVKDSLSGDVTPLNIQRMFLQLPDSEEKINVTYFAIEPDSFISPEVIEGESLKIYKHR